MILQNLHNLAGVNTNVSPFLQPPNSCTILNGGVVSYKLGAMVKDVGYTIVGTQIQANENIGGLYDFHQSPTVQREFATVDDATSDDTQLFGRVSAGDWTEIAAAETAWAGVAGANVEMQGFIGYLFIVGYSAVDGFLPVASVINTTFSAVTNVTNMAQGRYIVRYRDRLYVGNTRSGGTDFPYRVYFSSAPVAGAITWTPASGFFDVGYDKQITGMGENWDRLVIFSEWEAWMYDQTQLKRVWSYGCSNHRTIRNNGPVMYWANADGVYRSSGGQPENIAGEVIDFFRSGSPRNFFAEIVDEEYHLYVGTVTVNGVTYTNTDLIFNIPTQTWRWRELAHNMTIYTRFNDAGTFRLHMGDTTGRVYNKGKHTDSTLLNDDNGTAISSNFELAPYYVGNLSFTKMSKNLTVYAERAQGLKLKMRVLDRNARILTPYYPLGELKNYVNAFDIKVDAGALIQIAGSETGNSRYWSFCGYELKVEKDSDILKQ